MAAILFTCPHLRMPVQQWLPDDKEASEHDYEGVVCDACSRVHFVNRMGKVLGTENDD
jgi:hypothetical protein